MTDTTNWKYFHKFIEDGSMWSTNVMYTPSINPEETVMCMTWDENSSYRKDNSQTISSEVINYFFQRECVHLEKFQGYSWAPMLYDIDHKNRKIYLEWNSMTINHIFYRYKKSLDEYCSDWYYQIKSIVSDIFAAGYYKLALYPHCFYIKEGKIKTFDFYSCVGIQERYIERSMIEDMIGIDSTGRFEAATTEDGMVDFKVFFDLTLNNHLSKTWINDPFPSIYQSLNMEK